MKMKYLVPEIHVLGMDDTDKFGIGNSGNTAQQSNEEQGNAVEEQSVGFKLPVF